MFRLAMPSLMSAVPRLARDSKVNLFIVETFAAKDVDRLFGVIEVDSRQGAYFAEDALGVIVHFGNGSFSVLDLLTGQAGNILVYARGFAGVLVNCVWLEGCPASRRHGAGETNNKHGQKQQVAGADPVKPVQRV